MRRLFGGLAAGLMIALATPAFGAGTYCDGFRDGWMAAFRNRNLAPLAAPGCPAGGSTYEQGYEAGLRAALTRIIR